MNNGHQLPLTNRHFAETNAEFRAACARAGIPTSKLQASKFRRHFGVAWEHRNGGPKDVGIDKAAANGINASS